MTPGEGPLAARRRGSEVKYLLKAYIVVCLAE